MTNDEIIVFLLTLANAIEAGEYGSVGSLAIALGNATVVPVGIGRDYLPKLRELADAAELSMI